MEELGEQQFKIKYQQRTTIRTKVTKEINKIDPLFSTDNPDLEQAEVIAGQLKAYQEKLTQLDDSIFPAIEEGKLIDEIERADYYQENIIAAINKIQIRVRNIIARSLNEPQQASPTTHKDLAPRLPKLEINKYSGDPLLWDEFWDDFKSSVHDRTDLPTIDKFKYLKSFLTEEALQLADGYRLTVANYDAVITALRERFGDPQIATHSHFEALILLAKASHDLSELRTTLDKCESHIRSLVALGLPETTFGVVFTPLILSKLPKFVKMELHRKNGSTPWTLSNLRTLLKEEINAREKSERSFAVPDTGPSTSAKQPLSKGSFQRTPMKRPTAATLTSPVSDGKQKTISGCAFCSGRHYSSECRQYRDLNSRLARIKGRCHSCLRDGHFAAQCKSKRPCFYCRREGHHQSLCIGKFGNKAKSKEETMVATTLEGKDVSAEDRDVRPESSLSLQTPNSQSILQTALTEVTGKRATMAARLYFDTGCSRSFVSTTLVKKLGASYVGEECVSVGRFLDSARKSITYKIYEFDIQLPNQKTKRVRMSAESTISCPVQLVPLDTTEFPFLGSLKLAEPLVSKLTMVSVDILVGNDYYYDFIGSEQIRCSNGIILLSSPFGYVVGGAVKSNQSTKKIESSPLIVSNSSSTANNELECLWRLEDIGIKDNSSRNDDEEALKMFNDTVVYESQRYYVKWPWKASHKHNLPSNYYLALGRLRSLFRRIKSDEELLSAYSQVIQDQKDKGIIEEVKESTSDIIHYLPHHCVITPHKPTTKLRIVYDASAKVTKDSLSLNDCLHRGPVFLADLVGILIRMRLCAVAVLADIEKAFLQVALQSEDRDVTRFLWIKDHSKPLSKSNLLTYRFCRVPFGVVSSPFLLSATIAHHLRSVGPPPNCLISQHNVYVDNIFSGANTIQEAFNYYLETKQVFAQASMNLREWHSNSQEFFNLISESDRGKGTKTSVLGLRWDLNEDSLSIPVGNVFDSSIGITKRRILKTVASVFDPCGFFSPVAIRGKLLLQELWNEKVDWDDKLKADYQLRWNAIALDMGEIPQCKIPRRLTSLIDQRINNIELHCFCDASSRAYSAVVYFRTLPLRKTDLIFAKSRVAPINKSKLTIPQLELMAVLIGTRILDYVQHELRLHINAKYIRTDSSCVLHWIYGKPVTTVFVSNRLREIRAQSNIQFRFVSSTHNPADIPTRGVRLKYLQDSELWWHGPAFLQLPSTSWPRCPASLAIKEDDFDDRTVVTTMMPSSSPESEHLFDLTRFSTLGRLFRTTAYVFRFVHPAQLNRYDNLQIQCDELQSVKLFYRTIWHAFSYLVIKDWHHRLMHAGVRHTLGELRQEYWVVHGRSQVRMALRRCTLCRYYDGGPFKTPKCPQLPHFRAEVGKPFDSVGIDYLGPLFIHKQDTEAQTKVWICLFTCALVRAIHLEIVEGYQRNNFYLL